MQKSVQSFRYYNKNSELLINFLSSRFPYLTNHEWSSNIINNKIIVNNQKIDIFYILNHLDLISYERDIADEPLVDKSYKILYADEHFIGVEKNGNLPVSISGRYYHNTLIEILKSDLNINILYPIHRIDKETSGVVIFAKQKEGAQVMGKYFADGLHNKVYHAVLHGEMRHPITIDKPISRNNGQSKIYIRQICTADGKQTKTEFIPLKSINNYTLVKVITYSGRTHQIRCHAEFINHAIVGDKLYGKTDDFFLSWLKSKENIYESHFPNISRQLLHASYLQFNYQGRDYSLTSDYKKFFNLFSDFKDYFYDI